MTLTDLLDLYTNDNRRKFLIAAAVWIGTVAVADWLVQPNAGLGFLYVVGILLAAAYLQPWQVAVLASSCALLREWLSPFEQGFETIPRLSSATAAFCITGLFFRELARSRQAVVEHAERVQEEARRREEAEEQVRILISSSPAAIFIVNELGKVLAANDAAVKLLASEEAPLEGDCIWPYLPVLQTLQGREQPVEFLRVGLESKGRRKNGERFAARLWVSTYQSRSERRLAAIVQDASEDFRTREESGLDQLLSHSKILVGAVSHEVRNLCGAIGVVYENLIRVPEITDNVDFVALGRLTDGLRQIASAGLLTPRSSSASVRLAEVLDDLRIVIDPLCHEAEIRVIWDVPDQLQPVRGEHQGMLQVMLNLVHNSCAAMEHSTDKRLSLLVSEDDSKVSIRIYDTGSGVLHPERLFQPFQPGADNTGLGLYISRAIVRTFGGELRHEPQQLGSCFTLELQKMDTRTPVS